MDQIKTNVERPLLEVARRTGLRALLHGVNAQDADAHLQAFMAEAKAELWKNTSRISWMAAQGDLRIETFVLIGGADLVEIVDGDDDVIGRGATLAEALDDAMGVKPAAVVGSAAC